MKTPHLVIHECNSGRTSVLQLGKRDLDYKTVGQFVLKTMGGIVQHCAKTGVKPCMHLMPRSLTKDEYNKLDKIDWHIEAKELIDAVEQGGTEK